jgi:hypothetical protein
MDRHSTAQIPRPFPRWGWLFAAGPAIWSLYFWMEARAARIGCQVDAWPLVVWSCLALAGIVMVTVTYHASRSRPSAEGHPGLSIMRDGFLLGAGLAVAAVLVGVSTLISQPC